MNTQEAAALLAVAAAFDNRKPDADAAMAWAAALGDMEFNSCRDAVVGHYRESREWIMPADVVSRVRVIAAERMRPFGMLTPPSSIQGDVADERRWMLWARDEIVSGRATRPGDIGMDEPDDYPVRDLRELGIDVDQEPRRLKNPQVLADVAEPVAHLRALRDEATADLCSHGVARVACNDHRDAETEPTEEPAP